MADSHGPDAAVFGQLDNYGGYSIFFGFEHDDEQSARSADNFGYDFCAFARRTVYGRSNNGQSIYRPVDLGKCRRPCPALFNGLRADG